MEVFVVTFYVFLSILNFSLSEKKINGTLEKKINGTLEKKINGTLETGTIE